MVPSQAHSFIDPFTSSTTLKPLWSFFFSCSPFGPFSILSSTYPLAGLLSSSTIAVVVISGECGSTRSTISNKESRDGKEERSTTTNGRRDSSRLGIATEIMSPPDTTRLRPVPEAGYWITPKGPIPHSAFQDFGLFLTAFFPALSIIVCALRFYSKYVAKRFGLGEHLST